MLTKHRKVFSIFWGLLLFLAIFSFSSGKASAASLAVDNNCTLPEAITAVNDAIDGGGCVKTGAAYGTDDVVNIPAGTITLSAELPQITAGVEIVGAGVSQTTIDGNGNNIFVSAIPNEDSYQTNVSIKNMKLTGGDEHAVWLYYFLEVDLENLEVTDSGQGVRVKASNILAKSLNIHNNEFDDSQDGTVGLAASLVGVDADSETSLFIEDCLIENNVAHGPNMGSGLSLSPDDRSFEDDQVTISKHKVKFVRTTISGNKSERNAGVYINNDSGPTSNAEMDLEVNAVTIADNVVEVVNPVSVQPLEAHVPVSAGLYLSGKLNQSQNFINVTISNNSVESAAGDNRNTVAGFFGALSYSGAALSIYNTTVTGNTVVQPDANINYPAFAIMRAEVNLGNLPEISLSNINTGSSTRNVLVADNRRNGQLFSCTGNVSLAGFGFEGEVSFTPENLGNNMTDDEKCTGFTYVANLYDTVEHEVINNGGPVPTIKLLPGSPAINGGGAVQGISTDARGVPRVGYVSVGAYQGELLAATTNNSGGKLAETGALSVSAIALAAIIVIVLLIVYRDYRRHKKPLKAVDPDVRYSFMHHVRVVTIPLFKYRVSIKVSKKSSLDSNRNNPDGLHKF